ncbi:MAG TPA: lantibiotic dehydratase, partial [Kofleriaceae bacterium]|nr:lantibiotic dehydratase [Kofleriaceae bacterium]
MASWSVLPAYLVRVAGFAFARLEALRCSQAAVAVERLDGAEAARGSAGRALDEALGRERYADHPAFDDPAARKVLAQTFKQVRAFARQLAGAAVPADALREVVRVVPHVAGLAAELSRTHEAWQDAVRAFERTFADELDRTRAALRAMYRDERLQEAVFLQSPEAFEAIRQLLATSGPRNKPMRRRERLAAMYAQRFCAKNDTNSICGPLGIGYAIPGAEIAGAPALEIVAEDARRETYFSHWAAQRLLDEAVRRAGDAARVTLQLQPAARFHGDTVAWCAIDQTGATFARRHARSRLPAAGAQLARALASPRTPAELAQLARELGLGDDEVAEFLDQLVTAGLVVRGPALPSGLFRPLSAVASELERWPASEARTWALAEVGALEALVVQFARAPLAERLSCYAQLTARFAAATGEAASRGEGR